MQYMAANPKCTLGELSEAIGIKRGTLGNIVIRIQDEGLIIREGAKKKGTWEVIGFLDDLFQ